MADEALESHKSPVQHRSWCVEWFGSQGDFIAGKATDPISLQRFTGLESLYAVGPLENPRGEVSIYDSAALISEVHDGLVSVNIDLSRRAAFLVYAIVENWRRTTIRRCIAGEQQLGDELLRFAVESGIDVDQPFPFLLQCHMAQATFHILCNQSDGEYNPHLHEKAKVRLPIADKWSRSSAFTRTGTAACSRPATPISICTSERSTTNYPAIWKVSTLTRG